ncbi:MULTISPECIES: RICIN domain-containing protein [Streptomyces]|uniref:RICIN domain-containing protein n=1 Tax=Streptomyces TaxID=1883 RepID=UPI00131E3C4E|nr:MULTISPECIES: RICIN domain-containing protein [Streptomyces]
MSSQEPKNPRGPAVRRAVTLPDTAGTPDPAALAPLGTESGAAAAAEAGTAEQPKVPLNESAPAGEPVESVASEAGTGATVAFAAGAPEIPAVPDVPPAAAESHADGHGSADTMASAVGDYPPGADTDTGEEGDEPPSGRPTKALLAAAAIAGAVLISLPFLAFGAGDDDRKTRAEPEPPSGVTVPKAEAKGPGTYTAESPAPPATEQGKESKSPSPETKPEPQRSSDQPVAQKKRSSEQPVTQKKRSSEPVGHKKRSSEQPVAQKKQKMKSVTSQVLAPDQRKNFQFKNVKSGRCADVPGMGKGRLNGPVLQHDCVVQNWDGDNQAWDFVLAQKNKGPGGRNLVVIKNRKSGLCLDLPGRGSKPNRTPISQTHCNSTLQDNQLWWVENRGGNRTFWIHNYTSDQRCLEVWGEDGKAGNDARLGIYTCSPADDHEWQLKNKGEA